jgi:hypothetical protein
MTRGRSSWTIVLAGLTILLAPSSVVSAGAEQAETVSLARIRRALEQPPTSRLGLPRQQADFSVEVHETSRTFDTILDTLDFRPGPLLRPPAAYPSTPPLFEVNVLPFAESLTTKVRSARRAHAERAAWAEAQAARREFCAAHICSGEQ